MNNDESTKVNFESENFQKASFYKKTDKPTMVEWVIKYSGGLITDETQANLVLVGIALVAFGLSAFLFIKGF